MNNQEKYNNIFCEKFSLKDGFDGASIKLNDTKDWDSVGHMMLIAALEEAFDIMFETEDILAFHSYNQGVEILKKYGIEM